MKAYKVGDYIEVYRKSSSRKIEGTITQIFKRPYGFDAFVEVQTDQGIRVDMIATDIDEVVTN